MSLNITGFRIDRIWNKTVWKNIANKQFEAYYDVHSFQTIQEIFDRWDIFLLMFRKFFGQKLSLLLENYANEYAEVKAN